MRESNLTPQVVQGKDLGNLGQGSAAESGAASQGKGSQGLAGDAELARLIDAWPRLPDDLRQVILAMLRDAADLRSTQGPR
jgi:hypothetical protein